MADKWLERTWEPFGRDDAYFGVCSDPAYRRERMTPEAREAFFRSGDEHVAWVDTAIRRLLVPDFAPKRMVDFGCGVARLLIPFSRIADTAVGVDISPQMLVEAARNVSAFGRPNVTLVQSDDALSRLDGEFDFVHSFIVLQHIPPARGLPIAMRLVDRLVPGGVGALHFTYGRRASPARKIVHRLRRHVPGVNALVNVAQRRRIGEPLIPMHEYRLESIFDALHVRGCDDVHALLTDHGGHLGAMLPFRTPASTVARQATRADYFTVAGP